MTTSGVLAIVQKLGDLTITMFEEWLKRLFDLLVFLNSHEQWYLWFFIFIFIISKPYLQLCNAPSVFFYNKV